MANKKQQNKQIDPDIYISELVELYPEVATFLITEYEIHCVGCFASQFDTLRNGAMLHGIVDSDFDEMLAAIENLINGD